MASSYFRVQGLQTFWEPRSLCGSSRVGTAPSPALPSMAPPPALPPPVLCPKSLQRNLLRHQAHPMKPHVRNGIFQLECAFGLGRTPSSRTKFQVVCASRHAVGTVTRVCTPDNTNPGSCWGLWLWVIVQHMPHAVLRTAEMTAVPR